MERSGFVFGRCFPSAVARYDLVVDGICDAYGGRALPYPQFFRLALRVRSKSIMSLRGISLCNPHIEVKSTRRWASWLCLEDALKISPIVSNLRVRKVVPL